MNSILCSWLRRAQREFGTYLRIGSTTHATTGRTTHACYHQTCVRAPRRHAAALALGPLHGQVSPLWVLGRFFDRAICTTMANTQMHDRRERDAGCIARWTRTCTSWGI